MCLPANSVSIEIKKEKTLGLVIRGFTPLLPDSACTHAEARQNSVKEAWQRGRLLTSWQRGQSKHTQRHGPVSLLLPSAQDSTTSQEFVPMAGRYALNTNFKEHLWFKPQQCPFYRWGLEASGGSIKCLAEIYGWLSAGITPRSQLAEWVCWTPCLLSSHCHTGYSELISQRIIIEEEKHF